MAKSHDDPFAPPTCPNAGILTILPLGTPVLAPFDRIEVVVEDIMATNPKAAASAWHDAGHAESLPEKLRECATKLEDYAQTLQDIEDGRGVNDGAGDAP